MHCCPGNEHPDDDDADDRGALPYSRPVGRSASCHASMRIPVMAWTVVRKGKKADFSFMKKH